MDHRYPEDSMESPASGAASRSVPGARRNPEARPNEGYGGADLVGAATDILGAQLRDRPIPTLLVAVAAGWLLGKILR